MQQKKMEISPLWVKASFSLNAQEIVIVISYKLMRLLMQRDGGFEEAN